MTDENTPALPKIRIKWENGNWRAYFNGEKESHFHTSDLPSMIKIIRVIWTRET